MITGVSNTQPKRQNTLILLNPIYISLPSCISSSFPCPETVTILNFCAYHGTGFSLTYMYNPNAILFVFWNTSKLQANGIVFIHNLCKFHFLLFSNSHPCIYIKLYFVFTSLSIPLQSFNIIYLFSCCQSFEMFHFLFFLFSLKQLKTSTILEFCLPYIC